MFQAIFQTLAIAGTLALQPTAPATNAPEPDPARAFMDSLALADSEIDSMTGQIQYVVIQSLESDLQKRTGQLYLRTLRDEETGEEHRDYAVRFNTLQLDDRLSDIREHFIFDGRYFVERLADEKQFNKRELVPLGEELDPMELMREAPFWVSLGRNTDRVFESYAVDLLDHAQGLADNEDYPELGYLVDTVKDTQQIKLSPKEGSGFEDDWDWVRIWFDQESMLPRLYVKADWTGDLQIVQLFSVQTNTDLNPLLFDTTTPPPESGWRTQISSWRGDAEPTVHSETVEYKVVEPSP
ncbi:MAG: LolA family protein [Phycisphaerales bacterium]